MPIRPSSTSKDVQENTFDLIDDAYKSNKGNVLREHYAEHLRQMKRCFIDRRAAFFPLRASAELCELLSYEGYRRAP
jgi:hypothetical protein